MKNSSARFLSTLFCGVFLAVLNTVAILPKTVNAQSVPESTASCTGSASIKFYPGITDTPTEQQISLSGQLSSCTSVPSVIVGGGTFEGSTSGTQVLSCSSLTSITGYIVNYNLRIIDPLYSGRLVVEYTSLNQTENNVVLTGTIVSRSVFYQSHPAVQTITIPNIIPCGNGQPIKEITGVTTFEILPAISNL